MPNPPKYMPILVFIVIASLSCSLLPSPAPSPIPSPEIKNTSPPLAIAPTQTSLPTIRATFTSPPTDTPFPTLTLQPTRTSTPLPEGEIACPGLLPSRLAVGVYAYVIPIPPLPSRVRTGAGLNFPAKGLAQPGTIMRVIDGPRCNGGQIWWKIDLQNSDLAGWVAEGDNRDYWIAPCPEQGHCPPLD
jgi:hypothetical protein